MKKTANKRLRSGRLYLHILTILVWLSAAACVVMLFRRRVERFEVFGIARGQLHRITSPVDGRLKSVPVELFEKVSQGQILAVLDDELLQAQLATLTAQVQHLMSQLVPIQDTMLAEAANLETDRIISQRRFYIDVENARLRILELKTEIETDRITAEDLAVEVKIAKELLDQDAIVFYELQKAHALYNALAKKIEENEHLLAQAEQQLVEAQRRREEFTMRVPRNPSVENALEPIYKEISVQEKLIDELLVQRKTLIIKSPIDGMVVQIQVNANQSASRRPGEDVLRRAGEIVLAGEPILTIAELEPREIVAYADEGLSGMLSETMAVQLVKRTEPAQIADSQVVRLGATMELIPQRLWRNPNVAQWGRPILIKIPPDMKLLPGETVGIRGL